MPETKNIYTILAEGVAERIIADAEALADVMEIPMGMERVGGRRAYLDRYQRMTPQEKLAERARVGGEKLTALMRGEV